MLRSDVIQPSSSPWASPIVLVRKKDGSLCFEICVDYRKVNSITKKDAYPLPRINDTLASKLARSRWFSTLDLLSGYWQVEVAEKQKQLSVQPKDYCLKSCPLVCAAPPQRFSALWLAGLQWEHCLVYLDDVIVLGCSFNEHLQNLQTVFQRLRQAGLKLKPRKCAFFQQKCNIWVTSFREKALLPTLAKYRKLRHGPPRPPVERFSDFWVLQAICKRLRPHSQTTAQAHRAKLRVQMDQECQSAFKELRHHLIVSPVLAFPDFLKPFIVDTGASDTGIGAVPYWLK